MAKPDTNMTAQQARYAAGVRDGLQRDTGRSFEEWVELARTCPETSPRARVRWMKVEHGLGQNRAMMVLSEAFGSMTGWDDPDALEAALWSDPAQRIIRDRIAREAAALGEVTETTRKGYTAWSRRYQFAAAKPAKGGVWLGLAVPPAADPRLEPAGRDGWSERLGSRLRLTDEAEVDDGVRRLLRAAYDGS